MKVVPDGKICMTEYSTVNCIKKKRSTDRKSTIGKMRVADKKVEGSRYKEMGRGQQHGRFQWGLAIPTPTPLLEVFTCFVTDGLNFYQRCRRGLNQRNEMILPLNTFLFQFWKKVGQSKPSPSIGFPSLGSCKEAVWTCSKEYSSWKFISCVGFLPCTVHDFFTPMQGAYKRLQHLYKV